MKRARAYLIEREREINIIFSIRYIFSFCYTHIRSPPLCDQRFVRDYNYKESHTNKFEQTRSGISLPTNLHLSCASVHVREGL